MSNKSVCETRKENKKKTGGKKTSVGCTTVYIIVIHNVCMLIFPSDIPSDILIKVFESTNVILGIRPWKVTLKQVIHLTFLYYLFDVDNKVILYEKCGEFL